jgi:hypothetical protein
MSSKMPAECDICCETFTKQVRKPILCKKCNLVACACCVKNYLLSKKDPHCMGCKVGWTDAYCSEILGGFMHGAYRNHTKGLLWDIEKARMPETMPAVERVIKIRKMKEDELLLAVQMDRARKVYENIKQMHDTLRRNIQNGNVDGSSKEEMEQKKKSFHRACPVADCAGFLSSQWKCGVCETWTCKECMEVIGKDKETEHVCNPDVLASAQLLKKETKPCPACSAAIYKISGCDQMWCTQCKVAFSWRTGLKVSGTIHNPHFYEWQRKNGGAVQNPGAVACGGLPAWGNYIHRIERLEFPDWLGTNYIQEAVKNRRSLTSYLSGRGSNVYGENNNLWHLGIPFRADADSADLMKRQGVPIPIDRNPNRTKNISWKCFDVANLVDMNNEPTGRVTYELKTSEMALDMYWLVVFLEDKHRTASHFQNVELDTLRRNINRDNDDNEMDRVSFILKEFTEKDFKTKLIKKDRKRKKKRAILDIYEVFNNVMRDCIIAIYDVTESSNLRTINRYNSERKAKFTDPAKIGLISAILKEEGVINTIREQAERMENVRKYANTELLKISKTYKQVVPYIKKDGRCYSTVKYEGVFKTKAEEVGIEQVYDTPINCNVYKIDAKHFNYKIPKALRKKYIIPNSVKEIEEAYPIYRRGILVRRRRY